MQFSHKYNFQRDAALLEGTVFLDTGVGHFLKLQIFLAGHIFFQVVQIFKGKGHIN